MDRPAEPAGRQVGWVRIAGYACLGGYLLLAGTVLIWGAMLRFRIPQAPIVDPDLLGYLAPAISTLTGRGFVHIDGRGSAYPAFVLLVLRLFGDLRAIPIAQHILGVGAGAVTLLAWNAMLRLVPPGGIPRQLARYFGLAPAAIYLGAATSIHYEHDIRPEAIFPFFTILGLLLSLLFIHARFIARRSSAVWLGGLTIFVAILVYYLKPSFALAALCSTAPVWISLILAGASAPQKAALAAAAILPGALLLYLPEQSLKRHDPWANLFLPETLISVHAPMILDQMSHDLAEGNPTPFPRGILQSAHDLLESDLRVAATITEPKAYPTLGFSPDYLMYYTFCVDFPKLTHWDSGTLARFYDYYYLRAARHEPSAMLEKVAKQMRLFYCSKNPAYRIGKWLDMTADYARCPQLIDSTGFRHAYPPLDRYVVQCNELSGQGAGIAQARRFTEWMRLLAAHYMDLLFVALASPVVLLARPFRRHLFWAVVSLWLVYSYNFGNCLTLAIIHTLEVTRYVRIQLIYTVFAQCLSVYFLLETAIFAARLVIEKRMKGS